MTGQAGIYDEWRRLRSTPGLQGLVEHQSAGNDYQERIESVARTTGSASGKHVGRGRVAYLPMVEFDGPLPPSSPNFAIMSEFWKMPKNTKELIDLVRWAAEGQIPLSIEGPDGLVANYTAQTSRRRIFVHLVNYNSAKIPNLQDIRVRVSSPGAAKVSGVILRSPETAGERSIDFSNEGYLVVFTVANMGTYALITIQW